MKPHIDRTWFGMIVIEGEEYEHDVLIRMGERVKKRKKAIKPASGTSSGRAEVKLRANPTNNACKVGDSFNS